MCYQTEGISQCEERGKKPATSIENFTPSIIFLQHESAVFLVVESDHITIDVTINRNK